jgi:stress response protein SCP2
MAINLQKGQSINLKKEEADLSAVTIGLGWDVGAGAAFDLDAVALLLNAQGKIANVGERGKNGDIIYYNNLRHPTGNIYHTGDNRTGAGEGDDEQIVVQLNALAPQYERVIFLAIIFKGVEKKQYFGKIQNAYIRAADAKGKEIFRYDLSRNPGFDQKCSMLFGELSREAGGWKFRAVGEPYDTDNLSMLLRAYL